jgi:hypothetical protein
VLGASDWSISLALVGPGGPENFNLDVELIVPGVRGGYLWRSNRTFVLSIPPAAPFRY